MSAANYPTKHSDSRFAKSLQALSQNKHRLLFFYSGSCLLCKSLQGHVSSNIDRSKDWLTSVPICCDDQLRWAPEMLHYSVEKVPCFVMLDQQGHAVAKSGDPKDFNTMARSLDCLVELARPT